jgi:chorismate dehydratase
MIDSEIVLSAVSYLNTKPFLAGLSKFDFGGKLKIIEETPAECSGRLHDNGADIGLIPVADLVTLRGFRQITSWGIGAEGAVKSVLLVSDSPIENLDQILLDPQSKTSNQLMQILADEYFDISCSFLELGPDYLGQIGGNVGAVLIGDRALMLARNYTYQYDLAEAWQKLTGLPFLFAIWVASKEVDAQLEQSLDQAFELGMQQRSNIASEYQSKFFGVDIHDYLTRSITYKIRAQHQSALELFLNKISLKTESL